MQLRLLAITALFSVWSYSVSIGAEERVWTSRKGADVTAQLLRVEGGGGSAVSRLVAGPGCVRGLPLPAFARPGSVPHDALLLVLQAIADTIDLFTKERHA